MGFDVVHVDGRLNSGILVHLSHKIRDVRVSGELSNVALHEREVRCGDCPSWTLSTYLEVHHVHLVEANEGHEQPQVHIRQARAANIPGAIMILVSVA